MSVYSPYKGPGKKACPQLMRAGPPRYTLARRVTIRECDINNGKSSGLAIVGGDRESAVLVIDTKIHSNTVTSSDAGVHVQTNFAGNATFLRCELFDNRPTLGDWLSRGGGMRVAGAVEAFIHMEDCDIHHNEATSGAGIILRR